MNPNFLKKEKVSFKTDFDKKELKRGDAILFKYPRNKELKYFYRVVRMPGDKVKLVGQKVYLNGSEVKHEAAPNLTMNAPGGDFNFYKETVGSKSYYVAYLKESDGRRDYSATVKKGRVFVLGDNRDRSADSRLWGQVPIEDIISIAIEDDK